MAIQRGVVIIADIGGYTQFMNWNRMHLAHGQLTVAALLEEGWRPEDVALLTTGTRHPEQQERQAAGNAAYWDSFWDADQVFYGHVLGFKGLERRAVVLVVNEKAAFERSCERLCACLVPAISLSCAAT
jgi:hypothetical protein